MRSEITADRDLPSLLWFRRARLVPDSPDRALELAKMTSLESLRNQILWYSAKTSATGRNSLVAQLAEADGDQRINLTLLLELAVRGLDQAVFRLTGPMSLQGSMDLTTSEYDGPRNQSAWRLAIRLCSIG